MSMCRVFSCIFERGCLLWPVCYDLSWQNSISLFPASFCIPRPNLWVIPGVSWLPTFAFQSPIVKSTSFWGVSSKRSCKSSQNRSTSDRMWSTGEGSGKPLLYSCLGNPMNNMKRQNDRILKEELPRSVAAQYATGDQWRNNSRKNEGMEPKQKQYPVVVVTG